MVHGKAFMYYALTGRYPHHCNRSKGKTLCCGNVRPTSEFGATWKEEYSPQTLSEARDGLLRVKVVNHHPKVLKTIPAILEQRRKKDYLHCRSGAQRPDAPILLPPANRGRSLAGVLLLCYHLSTLPSGEYARLRF